MKLIRYILLTLLLPVFPAGAQNLCGSRVQVANPSILIGDNGRVMIGMDVTFPADMQLSSNRVATLTPVLKTRDNSYNKVLPAIRVYGRKRSIVQQREHKTPVDAFSVLRRKNGTLVEFGERPGSVALAVPTFDMLPGQSLDNILGFAVFENLVEVDRLTGSVEHFHKGSLLILLRCLCTHTSSFRSW